MRVLLEGVLTSQTLLNRYLASHTRACIHPTIETRILFLHARPHDLSFEKTERIDFNFSHILVGSLVGLRVQAGATNHDDPVLIRDEGFESKFPANFTRLLERIGLSTRRHDI